MLTNMQSKSIILIDAILSEIMTIFFQFLFWTSLLLFIHSYIFYPFLVLVLSKFKKQKTDYSDPDEWPQISTITSVYNESAIVSQKIKSLLNSDYPKDKLKIFVGSDASSDNSNQLILNLAKQNENIYFSDFPMRRGKAKVINDLMDSAREFTQSHDHIFVFTDANVILEKSTLKELVKPFSNQKIGLVDSRIFPVDIQNDGISKSENTYIGIESKLKYAEGNLWGVMMGAFGGCFAIRSELTRKVPHNFLMDDFYISMGVLDQNKKCISNPAAVCTEAIPNKIQEEFKRKTRISSGNFQNLVAYSHFLWQGPLIRWFAFISHKVLRWVGPFFMIVMLLTSLILSIHSTFYLMLFAFIFTAFAVIPILDYILETLKIHFKLFRNIRYFVIMNIALLKGFSNYIQGIKSSSWQPPIRNN